MFNSLFWDFYVANATVLRSFMTAEHVSDSRMVSGLNVAEVDVVCHYRLFLCFYVTVSRVSKVLVDKFRKPRIKVFLLFFSLFFVDLNIEDLSGGDIRFGELRWLRASDYNSLFIYRVIGLSP